MPTDVAPLVIDEYTTIVNVASDGEVLTETALSNMMVAALNRIEHVRQNIPAISTEVPRIIDINEEFMSLLWDSTNGYLHAGRTWRTEAVGTPSVTSTGSFLGNVGGATLSLNANNEEVSIHSGSSKTAPVVAADQVDRFACLVRPDSALGDQTILVGLAQDIADISDPTDVGNEGLAFFVSPGDTNWMLRTRTTGGTAVIDTGVPFVQGDIFLFELIRGNTGIWSCRINEAEVASLSDPADDVITDEQLNFGIHYHAGSGTTVSLSFIYLGLRTVDLGQRYD